MNDKKPWLVLLVIVALIGFALAREWPWIQQMRRVKEVTIELPPCDRVEVCHLAPTHPKDAGTEPPRAAVGTFPIRPDRTSVGILESKTLNGADAEAFAALWRSQTFISESQKEGHEPNIGLRFYSGSLTLETTVSFKCGNFYITHGDDAFWWGFHSGSPQAAALAQKLLTLFPPPPEKEEPKPAEKPGPKTGKKEKPRKGTTDRPGGKP